MHTILHTTGDWYVCMYVCMYVLGGTLNMHTAVGTVNLPAPDLNGINCSSEHYSRIVDRNLLLMQTYV